MTANQLPLLDIKPIFEMIIQMNKVSWWIALFVTTAFGISCSTGPDYKRDSEYDSGSDSYRSGVPETFSIAVTDDAFYRLSWSDVKNVDGYIIGRGVYSQDTTIYKKIAILEEDETSFSDSSGIREEQYVYSITTFTNNDGNVVTGRDSLVLYAQVALGEIEYFQYMEADESEEESQNRIVITTKAVHETTTAGKERYDFKLLTGVVMEYQTEGMDSFVVLDTLPVPITSSENTITISDTLRTGMKKFRVKPVLKTDNIEVKGTTGKIITRTVDNPYRISSFKRLDEILVEYTISVGDNLEQDEEIFDGAYIYIDNVLVVTLKGDFPQTTNLSTKGYSGSAEIGIRAYINDYVTQKRGKRVKIDNVMNPVISGIDGDLENVHTIKWTHQQYFNNADVHSFIVERRTGVDEPFEEIGGTGPDNFEFQSTDLTDTFYEYRVRTQTSNPSDIVSTGFTNFFRIKNRSLDDWGREYQAISVNMKYRILESDNYVFDVYQNQNLIDEIDLHKAGISDELEDNWLSDASFSEDENFVVFLLIRKLTIRLTSYRGMMLNYMDMMTKICL